MEQEHGELRIVSAYSGPAEFISYFGEDAKDVRVAEVINFAKAYKILDCWNAHASLQAKADVCDELVEACRKSLAVISMLRKACDEYVAIVGGVGPKWTDLDKLTKQTEQALAKYKQITAKRKAAKT